MREKEAGTEILMRLSEQSSEFGSDFEAA